MADSTRKKFMGSSFSTPKTSASLSEPVISHLLLISQSELEFSHVIQIGKGGSGVVYQGHFRKKEVAVKVYDVDNPQLPIYKRMLAKEAAQLIRLEHTNVVKCLGVCYEKSCLVLALAKKSVTVKGVDYTVHSLRQLIDVLMFYPQLCSCLS